MPSWTALCLCIILGSSSVATASVLTSAPAEDPDLSKRYSEPGWPIRHGYVAFGDSFAAGMGTGETSDDPCRVGSNNFAALIHKWTAGRWIDFQPLMCSGDTTEGVHGQIEKWKNPQKADLATLSVGGNDLDFSNIVWHCILTPNLLRGREAELKLCEGNLTAAENHMRDDSENGLASNLKSVYRKIIDKSGKRDFFLYVTNYPLFFNPDTDYCDRVTFWYLHAHHMRSDTPWANFVLLVKENRRKYNELVAQLNGVIFKAVTEVNNDLRREYNQKHSQVFIVDPNQKWSHHHWCEDGVEEPDKNRAETWFFLSGWNDFPPTQGNSKRKMPSGPVKRSNYTTDVDDDDGYDDDGYLKPPVGVEFPSPHNCAAQLGKNPDPWEQWKCRVAEAMNRDPDGEVAKWIERGRNQTATGNLTSREVHGPATYTRQIKTFHPRSPGMQAYRDVTIEAIRKFQSYRPGQCIMYLEQVWTCEAESENLYANIELDCDDRSLTQHHWSTTKSTQIPGVPINDANPYEVQVSWLKDKLKVVGEHVDDYIQFYYGDKVSWTTKDQNCELTGPDWNKNGPQCPGWPQTRRFQCAFRT